MKGTLHVFLIIKFNSKVIKSLCRSFREIFFLGRGREMING